MSPEYLRRLQEIADSIEYGLASISVATQSVAIYEPDPRPGHEGENRLADRVACAECDSTGEVKDGENFPVVCPDCGGRKEICTDRHVDIEVLTVTIGHKTKVQIDDRGGKGRIDRRALRTLPELEGWVARAVGSVAAEVAHSENRLEKLNPVLAGKLLDVAVRAGVLAQDTADAHKAAHLEREAAKMTESPAVPSGKRQE